MLLSLETGIEEVSQEDVSFDNTTNFAQSITNKVQNFSKFFTITKYQLSKSMFFV